MAVRKVSFIQEEYYHIYNRGNSKQIIFHDKEDYERFIGLLYACNSSKNFRIFSLNNDQSIFDFNREKQLCAIGAYVLMPNHFHLLLTQIEDRGISKFMQKLTTAYVMYYNKKY
ncbi:MAG: REP-associated tyrosine transposase, partial [Patescibacteria group bacterium]|nr:REP-associated tyrosine transposase [Patescibacteria group bacterium]